MRKNYQNLHILQLLTVCWTLKDQHPLELGLFLALSPLYTLSSYQFLGLAAQCGALGEAMPGGQQAAQCHQEIMMGGKMGTRNVAPAERGQTEHGRTEVAAREPWLVAVTAP